MTYPPHEPDDSFASGRSQVPPPPFVAGTTPLQSWPAAPEQGKPGFYRRLSGKGRAGVLIAGVLAASLVLCFGGVATIGLLAGASEPQRTQTTDNTAEDGDQVVGDRLGSTATTPAPATPTQPAVPTVETKTVNQTEPIAFTEKTVNDSALVKGTRQVRTAGVNGVKTLTYEVTYTDGVETARKLVTEVVTQQPVNQVTAVGTKAVAQPPPADPPASSCDPNYSGCVPIASDVDCEGGSGDGPAYVRGPVQIIGTDIYKLDGSPKNGIGCES